MNRAERRQLHRPGAQRRQLLSRFSLVIEYSDGTIDIAGDDDQAKVEDTYRSILRELPDGVAAMRVCDRGEALPGLSFPMRVPS
jgi:hypothetical protein